MSVPCTSPVVSSLLMALVLGISSTASADALTENFDAGIPAGWTVKNLSEPQGTISWFQGNAGALPAHQGAANSYLAANLNSGAGVADISSWLILPTSTYRNGDTLSFFTRTEELSTYPDKLEVRFSNVGGSDVGSSASSVGSFSTLLLSVNPDQALYGYPEAWTQYSVTLDGLAGATTGALAFRYFVTDGGEAGSNSNYIGIDTLTVSAVPEPGAWLMMGTGLGLLGFMRRRKRSA